jgi:prefoldin subunit 5
LKEDQELELSSIKIKLCECQSELNKRSEESKILEKEAQKLRAELDKINRERNESMNSVKLSYEHSIMELKHNMDNLNESL